MATKLIKRNCPICNIDSGVDITQITIDKNKLKSSTSKYKDEIIINCKLLICKECSLIYYSSYPDDLYDLYVDNYRNVDEFDSDQRRFENLIKCVMWNSYIHKYIKKGDSFLDIGCSEGFLLEYMTSLGLDASGYEINKISVDYGLKKKRKIFQMDILDVGRYKKKLDFVFMSGLVEHLEDPKKTLKHIRENIIKENGYIYIGVPDAECPSREFLSDFFPIEHLQTFTVETLSNFLVQCGYSIIKTKRDVYNSGIFVIAQAKEHACNISTPSEEVISDFMFSLKIEHDNYNEGRPFKSVTAYLSLLNEIKDNSLYEGLKGESSDIKFRLSAKMILESPADVKMRFADMLLKHFNKNLSIKSIFKGSV